MAPQFRPFALFEANGLLLCPKQKGTLKLEVDVDPQSFFGNVDSRCGDSAPFVPADAGAPYLQSLGPRFCRSNEIIVLIKLENKHDNYLVGVSGM